MFFPGAAHVSQTSCTLAFVCFPPENAAFCTIEVVVWDHSHLTKFLQWTMSSDGCRISSKITLHCLLWGVSERHRLIIDTSSVGKLYKCESLSLKRMVRNLSLALAKFLEDIRINLNFFLFSFLLVILWIYISNDIPFPGFPSRTPLSHRPPPCF